MRIADEHKAADKIGEMVNNDCRSWTPSNDSAALRSAESRRDDKERRRVRCVVHCVVCVYAGP